MLFSDRRVNWITLKMRKLIKPKSRERMRSLTLTPCRSESSDGFLAAPQDSQDSSSMGSGSLDDPLSQKRSGSEYELSGELTSLSSVLSNLIKSGSVFGPSVTESSSEYSFVSHV